MEEREESVHHPVTGIVVHQVMKRSMGRWCFNAIQALSLLFRGNNGDTGFVLANPSNNPYLRAHRHPDMKSF